MFLITELTFVWFGLVVGISFVEAPLKFKAPGITRELGLGIGRLVFKALNRIELVLASAITVMIFLSVKPVHYLNYAIPIGILLLQTLWLLPTLTKRIDLIVSGKEVPKSKIHLVFIVLEVLKLVVLCIVGLQAR